MTKEERIDALNITQEEKVALKGIFFEYEDKYDRSDPDLRRWWLSEILPKSQRLLEERYAPRQEVKCLFVLVGTTIEPLFLSILTIRPKEKIFLISSSESKKEAEYISNSLRQIHGGGDIINPDLFSDNVKNYLENIKNIEINSDIVIEDISPQKVFTAVRENIGMYPYNEVGIDITGGKKSMTGGGYLVAAINNLHLFYVDFDEYIDNYPKPGTEFINILDNPYDIYNIQEESIIKYLWERQDFDAVVKVAGQTIKKLTDEKAEKYELGKERKRLAQIEAAAQCYSDWARFNYSKALDSVFDYYERKQEGILSILKDCKNLRKDAYGAILLSLDRWTRGVDALGLCDLDKSALCFTQAIEVLCEYRLYDMAVKGNVSPQFDIGTIHFDLSSLIRFLWDSNKKDMVISMLEPKKDLVFVWTMMMRFDKTTKPSSSNLIGKLSIRNKLAHYNCYNEKSGAEQISEIEVFKDTVKRLIELFLLTYQNEEKLKEKTFDVLQAPFNFAKYSDFDWCLLYNKCIH
jgi:hypothetical protein